MPIDEAIIEYKILKKQWRKMRKKSATMGLVYLLVTGCSPETGGGLVLSPRCLQLSCCCAAGVVAVVGTAAAVDKWVLFPSTLIFPPGTTLPPSSNTLTRQHQTIGGPIFRGEGKSLGKAVLEMCRFQVDRIEWLEVRTFHTITYFIRSSRHF